MTKYFDGPGLLSCVYLFQEATKVDQLDLEGKCMRRPRDKRYFRKTGVLTGSAQGRDSAW